ncbi:A24 family peptidase [Rathayibacter soli]|uniref:A24 family peptidase n=1 Tax=Rathayibacter soli TaxID=3144168 RepID=UPI0027E51502|nr:A24 family peptidase [Glaciibacter superstes]
MSGAHVVSESRRKRHLSTTATSGLAALISCGLAVAVWPILTTHVYAWILAGLLIGAGTLVAVVDVQTNKLPNRYVAPVAAAGCVQAAAIAFVSGNPSRLIIPLASAAVVFSVYTAMGLAGWFGFGDAKFAAALTVTVAISSGYASVFIVAIAMFIGGAQQLLLTASGRGKQAYAHGPALIAAASIILGLTLTTTP